MNITGVTKSKIGVLDIFGFEIFEKNSFEQMCINFANEKLQQHFTSYTFKMENALYESEGIDFKGVPYIDNQNVLDLLEKKRTGLFSMLNEELRVPRGSSKGFYNKAVKKHDIDFLYNKKETDLGYYINQRMRTYDIKNDFAPYDLFINVGGGHASIGTLEQVRSSSGFLSSEYLSSIYEKNYDDYTYNRKP